MVTTFYACPMPTVAETLGANLKRLRGKMTQEEFEERTKIAQASLSELENGKGWVQIQRLADRLAAAGFDPMDLLRTTPSNMDADTRECMELLGRATPTLRKGLLTILREQVPAIRSTSEV